MLIEQCRDEVFTDKRRVIEVVGRHQYLSQSTSNNLDQVGGRSQGRQIDSINENTMMQKTSSVRPPVSLDPRL